MLLAAYNYNRHKSVVYIQVQKTILDVFPTKTILSESEFFHMGVTNHITAISLLKDLENAYAK